MQVIDAALESIVTLQHAIEQLRKHGDNINDIAARLILVGKLNELVQFADFYAKLDVITLQLPTYAKSVRGE